METLFVDLARKARQGAGARIAGEVRAISGLTLTAAGLGRTLGIGHRCRVLGRHGPILGEVVGIAPDGMRVLPFGTWHGVAAGDAVEALEGDDPLWPCDAWRGRVIDGLGRPLDGLGPLPVGDSPRAPRAAPPPAFGRRRIGARIATGVAAVDLFAPLCRGQRMGVFAGSGVGKSTLLSMLARRSEAEIVVIGLVGERGREVQDFVQEGLGPEGMTRSVLVVSTGDEPPLMRRQAAWTATAVAERFRDEGRQVLLLLDSVTRFALAQREIGLAAGEPPAQRGFPPTTFAELAPLLERAGPGGDGQGDVTAIYTVLVEGDDMNDPVADAVRGILDGHLVLDRAVAEHGRYPPIDLRRSVSRMMPSCHSEHEAALAAAARRAAARHADMEDLIRLGAYRAGSDPEVDRAIALDAPLTALLNQRKHEAVDPGDGFAALAGLLAAAGIDVGAAVADANETTGPDRAGRGG